MKNNSSKNEHRTLYVSNNSFFEQIKQTLDTGKKVIFPVSGISMRPFLKHGDLIVLKPILDSDLKIGRIILANTKNGYILHRIIKMKLDQVWMAGDGNLLQKEVIHKKDIMGVVEGIRIGNEIKNTQSLYQLTLARIWYYMRPARLVYFKLFVKKK